MKINMKTEADDPVYPTIEECNEGGHKYMNTIKGMNLRQHYAGLAMQGLCAERHCSDTQGNPESIANLAVACADALIAELNKD